MSPEPGASSEASPKPAPAPYVPPPQGRYCWLWACAGSVMIGVALPVLLTCWFSWPNRLNISQGRQDDSAPKVRLTEKQYIRQSAHLMVVATICCGPGAIVLGLMLFALIHPTYIGRETQPSFLNAVFLGIGLAFLNLPGYLVATFIPIFHMFLLFAVTGATCGLWVGWQAWRSVKPGVGWVPRFSLKTMLLLVVAWAALLKVFAPGES